MGFPILDDGDCDVVWRTIGALEERYRGWPDRRGPRGARFDAILKELSKTAEWPRQGKRLDRHLAHLLERGLVSRVKVSRKVVRYEPVDLGAVLRAFDAAGRDTPELRLVTYAGSRSAWADMEKWGPREGLRSLDAFARLIIPRTRPRGRPRDLNR